MTDTHTITIIGTILFIFVIFVLILIAFYLLAGMRD